MRFPKYSQSELTAVLQYSISLSSLEKMQGDKGSQLHAHMQVKDELDVLHWSKRKTRLFPLTAEDS